MSSALQSALPAAAPAEGPYLSRQQLIEESARQTTTNGAKQNQKTLALTSSYQRQTRRKDPVMAAAAAVLGPGLVHAIVVAAVAPSRTKTTSLGPGPDLAPDPAPARTLHAHAVMEEVVAVVATAVGNTQPPLANQGDALTTALPNVLDRGHALSRPPYRDPGPGPDQDHLHNYGNDRYNRGGGGGGGRGGMGGMGFVKKANKSRFIERGSEEDRRTSTSVYVGNLPYQYRERDIADLCEPHGRIRSITLPIDRQTSNNKGFAFVQFEDRRDAEDFYEDMQRRLVEGRKLKLDWDIGKDKKEERKG
ncbi:hypothetical protein HK102_000745, partial [Quaeritorhiza haematococci]